MSVLCVCLVIFQVFFPYAYYSSFKTRANSDFTVGVSYVYEFDAVGNIYNEVARIKQVGFRVVRVNLYCDPTDPNAYLNNQTDEFFLAAQNFGLQVALFLLNHESVDKLKYYLGRWGENLTFIQVMNEPELSQSWDLGTLFTDDEIISQFQSFYSVVQQFRLSAKLYTNFESGFILRANIPITLSKNLDFVGFDVYMPSFLMLSPNFVHLLQQLTGKEVAITEFGMSTTDDVAQSNFLIQGLNLFKGMGLKGCWLVYWSNAGTNYGIDGRLAEQKVGEWIAANS